jgi:arsenic resistance protein ArsH
MLKAAASHTMTELPNIAAELFDIPTFSKLSAARPSDHAPRILLLYGSLRERSYSKLLTLG